MNYRSANRAFTLIEMIVAAFVLVIGIAGALGAISAATRASSVADEIHTSALLARQRMSEAEMQPDQLSAGQQQGTFAPEFPEYSWQQRSETTDYQNMFRVTIIVKRGSGPGVREFALTTYLSNGQAAAGAGGSGGSVTPATTGGPASGG